MYLPFHVVRFVLIKYLMLKSVGKNCFFCIGVKFTERRKTIVIGNNCVVNTNVLLDGRGGQITIGNNVDIAQDVQIWTLDHDPDDDYHRLRGASVTIEDNVWICTRSIILPGVTIGRGAIVACNSVVTKNVPPMAKVGGIPAKVIGQRTSKMLNQINYHPWFT